MWRHLITDSLWKPPLTPQVLIFAVPAASRPKMANLQTLHIKASSKDSNLGPSRSCPQVLEKACGQLFLSLPTSNRPSGALEPAARCLRWRVKDPITSSSLSRSLGEYQCSDPRLSAPRHIIRRDVGHWLSPHGSSRETASPSPLIPLDSPPNCGLPKRDTQSHNVLTFRPHADGGNVHLREPMAACGRGPARLRPYPVCRRLPLIPQLHSGGR